VGKTVSEQVDALEIRVTLQGDGAALQLWLATAVASLYKNEGEGLSMIACEPMVPEAMRAAFIL